ncbi:hypothetical protein SDC9_83324 [bioreactor metagenome]|uniref:Uncharacterized protein n=1 Tax=bioreactor metagenome TaxID=1076179 RepID=A0A644Z7D7_9ZZZZ
MQPVDDRLVQFLYLDCPEIDHITEAVFPFFLFDELFRKLFDIGDHVGFIDPCTQGQSQYMLTCVLHQIVWLHAQNLQRILH